MRRGFHIVACVVLLCASSAYAGVPPMAYAPEEIISKAIAYHDPNDVWSTGSVEIDVHTTYSKSFAEVRKRPLTAMLTIAMSPAHETFAYTKEAGEDRTEVTVRGGEGSTVFNGEPVASEAERERLGIAEPAFYRDYFEYLFGMPMKLRDPGAILAANANSIRFNGRVVWEVRVTYDPEVGSHSWRFYFDHDTFALVGYRFNKDESKNDGEYITMEGEIVDDATGLRLPKTRAWYYNDGDGHLATDDIVAMRVTTD